MSSWSSSARLCTGACRPCWSSPSGAGRLAYSETGSGRNSGRGIGRPGSRSVDGCGSGGALRDWAAAPPLRARGGRDPRPRAAATATCVASPGAPPVRSRRAGREISFCAGTGSSSIRGMRSGRVGRRSGCGGINASGSCGSGPLTAGSMNSDGLGASGQIVTSWLAPCGE